MLTQPDSSLKPVGSISGVLPEEARRKFSSPAFPLPQTTLSVPHWPHSVVFIAGLLRWEHYFLGSSDQNG